MQKFKSLGFKLSKFANLNNFLNFPQLILLCVYLKFYGKDTGIGLIGAEGAENCQFWPGFEPRT